MILLDERSMDPQLSPYFAPYDVSIDSVILDAGDILFAGNGPNGTTTICFELKRIGDLCSSIRSKRLAGFQLDGLLEHEFAGLVVQGIYRPQKDTGLLEVLKGREWRTQYVGRQPILYREVMGFLSSMQFICGLTVIRSNSPEETAALIVGMYKWFEKPWEKHKAHRDIYAPVPEQNGRKASFRRVKPSLAVKIAAQLPGVDSKAWEVAGYFEHSVMRMMAAGPEMWGQALKIKDRKSKTVRTIMESIQ